MKSLTVSVLEYQNECVFNVDFGGNIFCLLHKTPCTSSVWNILFLNLLYNHDKSHEILVISVLSMTKEFLMYISEEIFSVLSTKLYNKCLEYSDLN